MKGTLPPRPKAFDYSTAARRYHSLRVGLALHPPERLPNLLRVMPIADHAEAARESCLCVCVCST